MADLFIDGFEQFKDALDPPLKGALERAGYTVNGDGVQQVAGRLAGYTAIQMSATAVKRTLPWTGQFFSAGLAFQLPTARSAVLSLVAGDASIAAWLSDKSGAPYLNEHMGGSQPYVKTWYYVELQLDRTAGTMSMWINNRLEVADVELPAGVTSLAEIEVCWGSAVDNPPMIEGEDVKAGQVQIDDIYGHDGERLGPIIVTTRMPTGTVIGDWVLSPDAESHHATAAMLPPKPLDVNIGADTEGQTDAFVSNVGLPTGNTIVATGMCVLARKSPALEAQLGVFIGNDLDAARRDGTLEITETWTTHYQAFHAYPLDTKLGIEAAPFGIVLDEI